MIVITLTKVPNSLRGDLTKWCQEIQTGVYVGSFSARIREMLWSRILKNIGTGEATLVYSTNNELGYTFRTTRRDKRVVDFDGVPLMMQMIETPPIRHGFSKAAKYHKSKKFSKKTNISNNMIKWAIKNDFIAVDLETTGLNTSRSKIISIGAIKENLKGEEEQFYRLIKINEAIPEKITELTGLTSKVLNERGVTLEQALNEFRKFVGSEMIVGYNLSFDNNFLLKAYLSIGQRALVNSMKDLMGIVKEKDIFLDNYDLETVLKEYGIKNDNRHNALSDARATFKLAKELNKKGYLQI